MNLTLKLEDVKPLSTNALYNKSIRGKGKKRVHVTKHNQAGYIEQVARFESIKHRQSIDDFEQAFDPKLHYIDCDLLFFMPRTALFTKKGLISLNSIDLDNCQKCIIDAVFKNFNKLDDAVICEAYPKKLISSDAAYRVILNLRIKPLDDLAELSKHYENIYR